MHRGGNIGMKKEIVGIFFCMLLILPATVSASISVRDKEIQIYDGKIGLVLCIVYGRITNLTEEMVFDELHYTFDAISVNAFEFLFAPFVYFNFQSEVGLEGPCEIPKDRYRGFISDNFIIGWFILYFK